MQITASEEQIKKSLMDLNIPTLLMVMTQYSGDDRWSGAGDDEDVGAIGRYPGSQGVRLDARADIHAPAGPLRHHRMKLAHNLDEDLRNTGDIKDHVHRLR